MTTTPKPKKIRARYGLSKLPDGTITPVLDNSLKGLTEHAKVFPKPPKDLKTYGDAIIAYEEAIPEAKLDGGKNAVALKNKRREVALQMYTENAHYVAANCNQDMQTFLLSGFLPASTVKTPPSPLDQPSIAWVAPGSIPGQLRAKTRSVKKAGSYELRYAPVPTAGETPASWTQHPFVSTKPTIINDLTPGINYMFQVRALGLLGHTDWSDPVTCMAN